MVMPADAQRIATFSLWSVAAVMFAAAAVWWWRSGSPIYVLGMLGGLLAAFNEPIADILVLCYHPMIGQNTAFSALGRAIPVWAVGCYPVYFGGLSLLVYTMFRQGVTRRAFWVLVGVVVAGNVAFEWPVLASGVYVYYGDQPFTVLGFPVILGVVNVLGAVLGALVMAHFADQLTGARQLLIPLLPAATMLASYAVILPDILTVASDAARPVKYLGAAAGVAAGLLVLDAIGRYAARRFPAHRVAAKPRLVQAV
jgi:hypothetical protein